MSKDDIFRLVILNIISKKKNVPSSYLFNQLFISIGQFNPVEQTLLAYEDEEYVRYEGYFDDMSKFLKI